jgi:5-methylthioribose kinase
MPRLLGFDERARVLAIEDLGPAADYTFLYDGTPISAADLSELAGYLRALHDASQGTADDRFANRDMRVLNHEHIFRFPLDPANGLRLDNFEPGLADAAATLQRDDAYRKLVTETGERYLADGTCLQHGDYFPGSFLRTEKGPRVIDPEFCFYGDREFDLGVFAAHLVLARRPEAVTNLLGVYGDRDVDAALLSRYAACEVMRRLIGVAQLPIAPTTDGWRAKLLEQSRHAMLTQSLEPLCNA